MRTVKCVIGSCQLKNQGPCNMARDQSFCLLSIKSQTYSQRSPGYTKWPWVGEKRKKNLKSKNKIKDEKMRHTSDEE